MDIATGVPVECYHGEMSAMKKLFKDTFSMVGLEIVFRSWPFISTVVVALIGVVGEYPWFYICIGTMLFLASAVSCTLGVSDWRQRNRVEHKLTFAAVRLGVKAAKGHVDSMMLGVLYRNRAGFPIECEVKSLRTIITDESGKHYYPPKKLYKKTLFEVGPSYVWYFDDHMISLGSTTESVIAEIHCTLLYGRKDRRRYQASIKKRATIQIDQFGRPLPGEWYDLP